MKWRKGIFLNRMEHCRIDDNILLVHEYPPVIKKVKTEDSCQVEMGIIGRTGCCNNINANGSSYAKFYCFSLHFIFYMMGVYSRSSEL